MSFWDRLRRRGGYEEDLERELRFHLDQHTEDLIAQGVAPEEARRQARLALGGPEQVKEKCRDNRPTRWATDLVRDVRYGVRILAKRPGFTAIAALALGLGIGVNTAILSAVHGFLFRPLPAERGEELVSVHWGRKADADVWGELSYANYVDLRERNRSFSDLCAFMQTSAAISSSESRSAGDEEGAEIVWGELVSDNYFDVMGVEPALGRRILPEEARTPGAHPVAVISHALWQRRYDADPAILGQTIFLNGRPYTVVGVMPESFLGSYFYLRQAFWAPLTMARDFGRRAEWSTDRGYALFNLFGRLEPGVTMAQAETDLNLVAGDLARLHPKENGDTKVQLVTELDGRYEDATKILGYGGFLALCVSGLVLLLACANVANLMLARAVTRAREIGIRLAIGASRGRVVRQLLTESVLLAALGGVLGWALAYWGVGAILALTPPVPYPLSLDFTPDGYVLRWMLVISLATGVVFGLAPALAATRTDLVSVIKGVAAEPSRGRRWSLRGALVVAQVTISIVVLICAGLFVRSLAKARETDPGFESGNLVTMMINPSLLGYDDREATSRLVPELLRRVEAQPGVRSAAVVNEMPMMVGQLTQGPIVREGEADPPPNQGVRVDCSVATPGYFETVGTPLVLGRDFSDHDDADAPAVVVVNQEFARRFYGGEQAALGKRFRFEQGTPLMEIVGIARDGRYRSLYEDPQPYMYLPVYQHPRSAGMTLVVGARSAGDIHAAAEGARREIARVDARLPVYGVMTAEENLSMAWWGPRVAAGMASTFGVLALVLATTGLYSVMSYTVSQRTREIGIRRALGAGVRDVVALVVSQGMRMVALGLALGMVGALALARALSSLLLGVGATDPVTFAGVAALLVAVALVACYIPARRATRVDPLVALRSE